MSNPNALERRSAQAILATYLQMTRYGELARHLQKVRERSLEQRMRHRPAELRNPYGRRYPQGRDGRAGGSFSYEREDQSASGVRTGMRVRHKQFGVGTVVAVEDHGDDFKVTVKFSAAGTKKLMARYAGLEKA